MEQVTDSIDARSGLRQPGSIMLISCYELGHQPIGLAQPMGFLAQAGFAPIGLDIGATSAEETALSIAAEIVAVLNRRGGGRLTEGVGQIHSNTTTSG